MRTCMILIIIQLVLSLMLSCSKQSNTGPTWGNEESSQEKKSTWLADLDSNTKVDLAKVYQKNYYIIFDGSGSMTGEKIEVAKEAVKKFINHIPDDANIGLTAFDATGNYERATLGSQKEAIIQRINSIRAGGYTPLGESSEIAYKTLVKQAKKQLGYGEYNLIIITDGEATDKERMVTSIDLILQDSPVIIHTIGFHINEGHALNQPGKIYYKTANNFKELSEGLEKVLAETKEFKVDKF